MMVVNIDKNRCTGCHYCEVAIACPGEEHCTECGACIDACPQSARSLSPSKEKRAKVTCIVNGETIHISSRQNVLQALESLGYSITSFPEENPNSIFAPCRTGGCWSCAVLIDGLLKPSCITPISDGITIDTRIADQTPKRIVSGFQGHQCGGMGTPKDLVFSSHGEYLEVACFASGCLYRCPTCQNWQTTYYSRAKPMVPSVAARRLTDQRHYCRVDRMAISGGESTLNRTWLVEFVKSLKDYNPDKKARIHVDTNAAILTADYIDELVLAGMTDIGPDLKGIRAETFTKITRVESNARKYLQTSWEAVKHLLDNHSDSVFLGVGIPYNKEFIGLEEIHEMGSVLTSWEPELQVTVLDYRPEFRARNLKRPSYQEMLKVREVLKETGLKRVICQTARGYIR
ncbi:MAG: radical SAM protein [Candidatus Odinarchaeota archaeon]